jgi:hypothetical protein
MASRERLTLPGAGGFVFPRPVSSARAPRDGSEGARGMFARDVEHATLAQDGRYPLPARGDLEQLDNARGAGRGAVLRGTATESVGSRNSSVVMGFS